MKKYYALNNKEEIIYIGEYPNFGEAWVDTEDKFNYIWIFKDINLRKLNDKITKVLEE